MKYVTRSQAPPGNANSKALPYQMAVTHEAEALGTRIFLLFCLRSNK